MPKFSYLLMLLLTMTLVQTSATAGTQSGKNTNRFRAVVKSLKKKDSRTVLKAMNFLGDHYPQSRPVLEDVAQTGSPSVRAMAYRTVGEKGVASRDLPFVKKALKDSSPKVRLAGVMAIRKLGNDGFTTLVKHLSTEADVNNRKMVVKTFQIWKEQESMAHLVKRLRKEKDRGVQGFIVRALESLSGKKYGNDLKAWENYHEACEMRKQALKFVGEMQHPTQATHGE